MKMILITDKPKDCTFCPCHTYMANYTDLNGEKQTSMCKELGKVFKAGKSRPSWCPLKPMPHSKQMENRWFSDDYSKGWNDCLAEIEVE